MALSAPATALELRYGRGDFGLSASLNPLLQLKTALPANTLSVAESHANIRDSRYYYRFQLAYSDSKQVDRMTDFLSAPLRADLPFIGDSFSDLIADNTALPVPADYRMRAVNLDFGLGYDLLKNARGHLGAGLNSGVSTPYMKVRNLESAANMLVKTLDAFDTEVMSYKFGLELQGRYELTPGLALEAQSLANLIRGTMDNSLVGSGIDIDGSYRQHSLALSLQPQHWLPGQRWLQNLSLSLGYSRTRWDYDSTRVNTPLGSARIASIMDMSFTHSARYIALRYAF